LNCSSLQPGDVGMAIYDPLIDDWNCTSTGNLPNDTNTTPVGVVTGLPHNCSRSLTAVWNHTTTEWSCSSRESLLYQSQPLIAENLCRSQDLLTTNYESSATDTFFDRPAGLCVAPSTRQVGPDAVVGLGRKRNLGDPDEAFYVQTTSKAIGGLGSAGGSEHFNWQYWDWSPMRSAFGASVGTYPPIMAFDNVYLVAVTSATYTYTSTNNVWTPNSLGLTFRVVKITNQITGTYPAITFIQYNSIDYTSSLTAPGLTIYTNTSAVIPGTPLSHGNALSIRIVNLPASLTGSPKNDWLAVSLWVSQVVAETATA